MFNITGERVDGLCNNYECVADEHLIVRDNERGVRIR